MLLNLLGSLLRLEMGKKCRFVGFVQVLLGLRKTDIFQLGFVPVGYVQLVGFKRYMTIRGMVVWIVDF